MSEQKTEEISEFFDRHAGDYELIHLSAVEDGLESKADIASHLPENISRLLDLGAGTGLELDAVFERFPDVEVTVVDISKEMLAKLQERFPHRAIRVVVSDYFTADLGDDPYDACISSMTMHHWLPEEKRVLYTRIHDALAPGGLYVENDYILNDGTPAQIKEKEACGIEERRRLDKQNPSLRHVHFDVPLSAATETQILRDAGFKDVEEVWHSVNNITLVSRA